MRPILSPVLLWFPLVHQPTVVSSSRQPTGGGMSQFRPFLGKLMSSPEVFQHLSMLKNHRGMEVILCDLQRSTFYEFLNPLPPRSVSLDHLLKLFLIPLLECSPIRLI